MSRRMILLAVATAAAVLSAPYIGPTTGQDMLVKHEAKVNHAYADPAHGWAVPTICVGHTRTAKRGMYRTDAQCMDLLQADVDVAIKDLRSLLGPASLTQGELLAYVSFVFNVGPTKLRGSTWQRKFKAGDRVGACNEVRRWVYSNGKKMRGLVSRRDDEAGVCLRDL